MFYLQYCSYCKLCSVCDTFCQPGKLYAQLSRLLVVFCVLALLLILYVVYYCFPGLWERVPHPIPPPPLFFWVGTRLSLSSSLACFICCRCCSSVTLDYFSLLVPHYWEHERWPTDTNAVYLHVHTTSRRLVSHKSAVWFWQYCCIEAPDTFHFSLCVATLFVGGFLDTVASSLLRLASICVLFSYLKHDLQAQDSWQSKWLLWK